MRKRRRRSLNTHLSPAATTTTIEEADVSAKHMKFFAAPTAVAYYAALYVGSKANQAIRWTQRHPHLLSTVLGLAMVYVGLHMVEGAHRYWIAQIDTWAAWHMYWVGLGVLSSVGLGAGLHTFVLFLGPHIARVALTARECHSTSFAVRGSDAFQCMAGPAPTFGAVMQMVALETVCWGAGTAIGELPPYFVSRAAAAAGHSAISTAAGPRALRQVGRMLRRFGFAGILAFAAVPNPLFDLAGVACGHFAIPLWTFFGATLMGKSLIKAPAQAAVVIVACSRETAAAALALLARLSPRASALAEHVLRQQAAAFATVPTDVPPPSIEELRTRWIDPRAILSGLWGTIVAVMLVYFAIGALETLAQSHLDETAKRDHKQQQHQRQPSSK